MTVAALELSLPVALSLFSDLIGRNVSGAEAAPASLADEQSKVRGVFRGDSEVADAVYIMDIELAAAAGAALVMMPAGLVRESVQDKALPGLLADNSFEVFNVSSRLINRAGGTHYKLREQVLPGTALPADAAEVVAEPGQRVDLELTVEGYGSGVLTIVVR